MLEYSIYSEYLFWKVKIAVVEKLTEFSFPIQTSTILTNIN